VATAPDIAEQRRSLPDSPGVYLFKEAGGKVIYVGKASSIRKRVAGHFSLAKQGARGSADMIDQIAEVDFIVTETEAEALLAEQRFIKMLKPLFNVRLRDDKSYPYIAISLDEEFPRVYFTRERHRRNRVYFGPFSSAKRTRETLDLLGKVFQYRTCEGAQPGRATGSPCLDYYIKRCQAPCVDYISKEEYRGNIDTIIDFLSGRYRQIERVLEQGMKKASEEQEFEQAADVVGTCDRMPVEPYEVRSPYRRKRAIEPVSRSTRGVVDYAKPRLPRRPLVEDLAGAIVRRPVGRLSPRTERRCPGRGRSRQRRVCGRVRSATGMMIETAGSVR